MGSPPAATVALSSLRGTIHNALLMSQRYLREEVAVAGSPNTVSDTSYPSLMDLYELTINDMLSWIYRVSKIFMSTSKPSTTSKYLLLIGVWEIYRIWPDLCNPRYTFWKYKDYNYWEGQTHRETISDWNKYGRYEKINTWNDHNDKSVDPGSATISIVPVLLLQGLRRLAFTARQRSGHPSRYGSRGGGGFPSCPFFQK